MLIFFLLGGQGKSWEILECCRLDSMDELYDGSCDSGSVVDPSRGIVSLAER